MTNELTPAGKHRPVARQWVGLAGGKQAGGRIARLAIAIALLAAPAFANPNDWQDEDGDWHNGDTGEEYPGQDKDDPLPEPEPEPETPAEYEDDGDQPRFTGVPECCAKLPDGEKLIIVDGKVKNPSYRIWCSYGGTKETTPVEKVCSDWMHPVGKLWGEE